jgi:hypothetical protein
MGDATRSRFGRVAAMSTPKKDRDPGYMGQLYLLHLRQAESDIAQAKQRLAALREEKAEIEDKIRALIASVKW